MGWFRVPINVMVIVLMFASEWVSHHVLFGVCAIMCALALVAHRRLVAILNAPDSIRSVPIGVIPVKSKSTSAPSSQVKSSSRPASRPDTDGSGITA